ncbi:hypothetical protein Bbelb_036390 [Branchiostoma belcheri]|nr:hypothetical protein Bbelb_036390 [Branchiostoma belcheri]
MFEGLLEKKHNVDVPLKTGNVTCNDDIAMSDAEEQKGRGLKEIVYRGISPLATIHNVCAQPSSVCSTHDIQTLHCPEFTLRCLEFTLDTWSTTFAPPSHWRHSFSRGKPPTKRTASRC